MNKERLEAFKKRAQEAVKIAQIIEDLNKFTSEQSFRDKIDYSIRQELLTEGRRVLIEKYKIQLEKLLNDTDETRDSDASGNGHQDQSIQRETTESKQL